MSQRVVHIAKAAGTFAEDKDVARSLRREQILPAIERGDHLVLDFTSVTNVTQSFMHACIAEPLRINGESVLDRIDFKGCNAIVRSVVSTVAEYSLRAFELGQVRAPTPAMLGPTDVPQADSLDTVRAVIDAIAAGATTKEDVAEITGYSIRHVHYRLHAARILGFAIMVGRNLVGPTDEAYVLYETRPGSAEELAVFERAIRASPIMRALAPDLLSRKPLLKSELSVRLERRAHLGRETAMRRAQALMAWRNHVQHAQLRLRGT